jgi:hypothetical protein
MKMGRPDYESRREVEDRARIRLYVELKCYKQQGEDKNFSN